MTKYLKFFTSDNDRTFYESSNEYLEPYVSVTKKNGGEVSKISYNLVPSIILTMNDSYIKKIYGESTLDATTYSTVHPDIEVFNVTNIQLSDKITSIRNLNGFVSLKSINIPNSVTTIESNAFNTCSSLQSIIIPASIKRIENNTFIVCPSLTSVTLTDSITYIDETAFQMDDNIHELKIIGKKDISNLLPSDLTNNLTNLYVDASLVETYKTYRDSISKTFEVEELN